MRARQQVLRPGPLCQRSPQATLVVKGEPAAVRHVHVQTRMTSEDSCEQKMRYGHAFVNVEAGDHLEFPLQK
jgi:hypothetical protein